MNTQLDKEKLNDVILQHPNSSNLQIARIAKESHGFAYSIVHLRQTIAKLKAGSTGKAKAKSTGTLEAEKGTQNISYTETKNQIDVSAKRITSLEDLLQQCNVDLNIWEVERYTQNKWEMAEAGGHITPLFQVKAILKRKTAANVDYGIIGETLYNRMAQHTPNYEPIKRTKKKDAHLLVIDAADSHFGKLVSSYENPGKTYNLDVATKRYLEGFAGVLEKGELHNIEKVMIVFGNDILHVDNSKRTTTSGTPQDTDGMFYDMFNAAFDATIRVVESIMQKYDVDLVFNPSNHDYVSGWMLARALEAWFRHNQNVKVCATITNRKYYLYGKNLIATSHGDGAKMQDLPLHMANEAPELWAKTKFRYCYLHHIHHYNKTKFQSGKDFIGVTVEYLRSPSEADSWHYRSGYTGSPKAIEGFLHHKENGQVAKFTHYF